MYTTSQTFLDSKVFNVFLKKSLLTKPAFIWSKIQQKQQYCEIFWLFKITAFYFSVSCDLSEIILICLYAVQETFIIIIINI